MDRNDERGALLLERAIPGTRLSESFDCNEANLVVIGILRELWQSEPQPGVRDLTEQCEKWAMNLEGFSRDTPLPRLDLLEAASTLREIGGYPTGSGSAPRRHAY